jgi:ubiquinone/menaquinone biosynthesis C-methylase UbiE
MKSNINKFDILKANKDYHDLVEAKYYDQNMNVALDERDAVIIINELESVLGEKLPPAKIAGDFGSGTGNLAINLYKSGKYHKIIALDLSKNSLLVAQDKAVKEDCNIELIVTDLCILPLADDSLDIIYGCAFLHHLPEPFTFFSELERILKPGGRFVIIGEPTAFGAKMINLAKLPLILLNKALILFNISEPSPWDHSKIDVHSFEKNDVDFMLKNFIKKKIVCEGFIAPILEQSFIVPIRSKIRTNKTLELTFDKMLKIAKATDQRLFNRFLDPFNRVTLKITGEKVNNAGYKQKMRLEVI